MARRLTTILAADIAGFSRLVGSDEEGVVEDQRRQRTELIDPLLRKHNGRIANTAGDSLLIEFPSAVEAVRCAVELQNEMETWNSSIAEDRRIEYRIGLNVGDVLAEGDDLLGDGVNIAARLETLAPAGGIVISRAVRDQVRDKLDVPLHDLGEISVKNIARPIRAFQLLRNGEAPISAERPASRRWRLPAVSAAAALALVVGIGSQFGFFGPNLLSGGGSEIALSAKPSVAVLPFTNLGGDDSQAYFTDGFTKAITTNISKFEDLFVVSSFSAFQFRDTEKPPKEIAQELGVRYLLTGDVQSGGDALRVNAQLIDADTGTALWAERYALPRSDVFDLQDDLSGKIAGTLIEQIEASARTVERTNMSAYDLVLRAVFTSISKEGLLSNIAMLERAILLDPDYSRAYAELSDRYLLLWRHSLADDLDDALRKARAAGTRAIELNNNSAESRLTLAKIYLYADLDHELALATISKALEINPNDADLMVQMAQTLAFMGRGSEAVTWIEKAMHQNPLHPAWYNWNAGFVYAKAGAHERAILESKKALAAYKSSASIRRVLIFSHAELGEWDEAKRYAAEILERTPEFRLSTHMRNAPHMKPDELEHLMEVFHEAGLPK